MIKKLALIVAILVTACTSAFAQTAKTPAQLLNEQKSCATLGQPAPCKSTTTLFGDVTQSFTPLTGSGAPPTSAYFVGEFYRDTTNNATYQAITAGEGAADWVAVNAFATGRTTPSIIDYGGICNGNSANASADTAALEAAQTALAGTVNALFIPGKCEINASVYLTLPLYGPPGGYAGFYFTSDLGQGAYQNPTTGAGVTGTAGIVYEGPWIRDLWFSGPGSGYTKGVAPAKMDCLRLGNTPSTASQPFFVNLTIENCNSGIVINTNYGHWWLIDSNITNNFYGIYLTATGGDNKMLNDTLGGNTMASIAAQYNSQSLGGGFTINDVHLGFGPYGIYREPGTDWQNGFGALATRGVMNNVGFECIGNGGIKEANLENGNQAFEDVEVTAPGFSWDNGANCYDDSSVYRLAYSGTVTCTETSGSAQLTSCGTVSGTAGFGAVVSGTDIPSNTYLVSCGSGIRSCPSGFTTINMSQEATGNGSITVTIASEWNYAFDIGGARGRFRLDMGPIPIPPGNSGSIMHAQTCGDTSTYGGAVDFLFAGEQGPVQSASAYPLYVVDNDNSTGCVGASTVRTPFFQPGGAPFTQITVDSGQTTGSLSTYLNNFAVNLAGINPICTPTTDPGTRYYVSDSLGSGSTRNDLTVTVTLAASQDSNITFNCRLN